MWTLTGGCVYTNARWQEITGLTLEGSLGQGWSKAIYSEDYESVLTEWQASVALGRVFSKEFRFVRIKWWGVLGNIHRLPRYGPTMAPSSGMSV